MLLRAKYVLPMNQPPIEDGAVTIVNDIISAVGTFQELSRSHEGESIDLGDATILPGLINSHCHLDYSMMIGQIPFKNNFTEWIAHLVEAKRKTSSQHFLTSISSGLSQLLESGTTTVVNTESFPELIRDVPVTPMRVWWCPELIDFDRTRQPLEIIETAVHCLEALGSSNAGFGLSPHAPYTASRSLYRRTYQVARQSNWLISTHIAESSEEDDMFRRGTGSMYDYFRRLGRDMSDCKHSGPVQLLADVGILGRTCLAIHANYLTPPEIRLLAHSGTHVVHCPKTHRFFHRGIPILEKLWAEGINVCLGTDSLASNNTLNMFDEMQELAVVFTHLAPSKILEMTTSCSAKALGMSGKLGKLVPGAYADIIAVEPDGPVADPYEAALYGKTPVCFSMIGGKIVRQQGD